VYELVSEAVCPLGWFWKAGREKRQNAMAKRIWI